MRNYSTLASFYAGDRDGLMTSDDKFVKEKGGNDIVAGSAFDDDVDYISYSVKQMNINGETYSFEDWMTWNDWVKTSYNTQNNVVVDSGYVTYGPEMFEVSIRDGEVAMGTDKIQADDYEYDESYPRMYITIDGTDYPCYEWYDFESWVDSNYNTDGFYYSGGYIVTDRGDTVYNNKGVAVRQGDDTNPHNLTVFTTGFYYSEEITFTVGGTSTYKAGKGFHWATWLVGGINGADKFASDGGDVLGPNGDYLYYESGSEQVFVVDTDKIIDGMGYREA